MWGHVRWVCSRARQAKKKMTGFPGTPSFPGSEALRTSATREHFSLRSARTCCYERSGVVAGGAAAHWWVRRTTRQGPDAPGRVQMDLYTVSVLRPLQNSKDQSELQRATWWINTCGLHEHGGLDGLMDQGLPEPAFCCRVGRSPRAACVFQAAWGDTCRCSCCGPAWPSPHPAPPWSGCAGLGGRGGGGGPDMLKLGRSARSLWGGWVGAGVQTCSNWAGQPGL